MTVTRAWWLWGAAIIVLFVLDRIVKAGYRVGVNAGYTVNPNVAFSIPLPFTVIAVVVSAVIIALTLIALRAFHLKEYAKAGALFAVALGAVSNLADRFFYSGVIDYLAPVRWWPMFNIADLLIVGGLIFWLFSTIYNIHEQ